MTFKPMPPCERLEKIPHRVNVRGFVQGAWGPLPNHFGEPVLGSMIKSGKNMVTLEESRPDAFPKMHTYSNREVTIQNALAGVWRGQPRLYLDEKSKITESRRSGINQTWNVKDESQCGRHCHKLCI